MGNTNLKLKKLSQSYSHDKRNGQPKVLSSMGSNNVGYNANAPQEYFSNLPRGHQVQSNNVQPTPCETTSSTSDEEDSILTFSCHKRSSSDFSEYSFMTENYECVTVTSQRINADSDSKQFLETEAEHTASIQLSKTDYFDNLLRSKNSGDIPHVFISYVKNVENDVPNAVHHIYNILRANCINAHLDCYEDLDKSLSFNSWLNNNLEQSKFVLLCITPNYKSTLQHCETKHSLHAKYVDNSLQNEYIENGGLHNRVLPVLCCGAETRDVPTAWRCTRIYEWPSNMKCILSRLYNWEEFQKPTRGNDPIITVCRT